MRPLFKASLYNIILENDRTSRKWWNIKEKQGKRSKNVAKTD